MRRMLLLICALVPTAGAVASAPGAWDAHYRSVVDRCLAASKLDKPKTEGHLMLFSDEIGTALLVRGKAKKKDTLLLCIVRRGSEAIEIQPVNDGIDPAKLPK